MIHESMTVGRATRVAPALERGRTTRDWPPGKVSTPPVITPAGRSVHRLGRIRRPRLLDLHQVLANDVMERGVPIADFDQRQPKRDELLFVQLLHSAPVVVYVRVLHHLGDQLGAEAEVPRNFIEMRGRLGLCRSHLAERVLLDRDAEVVSVFNLRNHICHPHLKQIRFLHDPPDYLQWEEDVSDIEWGKTRSVPPSTRLAH